jgi:hypothetical protein
VAVDGQDVDSPKNAFDHKLPDAVRFEVGACDCHRRAKCQGRALLDRGQGGSKRSQYLISE